MWKLCHACKGRYRGRATRCPLDGAELVDAQDPMRGRTLNARYVLLAQLGAGGMGAVYRARDATLDLEVAVKLLDPRYGSDPVQKKRFLGEATATRLLRHKHIVDIIDCGVDGADLYLVMELLHGESLDARLVRGALPTREALEVAAGVAQALGHAHERQVIHRDIKPGNVFLSSRAPGLRVLDFGIAHMRREEKLTSTGQIFGTPRYMSPEQARGEPCTAASDLYSLGVTLFEMLTGRTPFAGSVLELMRGHTMTPPPRLRDLAPEQPAAVEAIVDRLLAKNPSARPPGAEALARELDALLAVLPRPADQAGGAAVEVGAPTAYTLDLWRERSATLRRAALAAHRASLPPEVSAWLARLDEAIARGDREGFVAAAGALQEHLAPYPEAHGVLVDATAVTAVV